jgi:hypothetical protein
MQYKMVLRDFEQQENIAVVEACAEALVEA